MPTSARQLTIADSQRILSVGVSASPREIKAAWRRAVRRTHPDRNPSDPQARAKFDDVQEAYRVLSDPAVLAEREIAWAARPMPPFTVEQLHAFRTLGLGPNATYADIDSRTAFLIDAGRDVDGVNQAHEILTGRHRNAQKVFGEASPSQSRRPTSRPGIKSTRGSQTRSDIKALVLVVLGLAFIVATYTLKSRLGTSVNFAIATGLASIACFIAALSVASAKR